MRRMSGLAGLWLALLLALLFPAAGAEPEAPEALSTAALWAALAQPGHVVLVRHALAPGKDEPPGFDIDRCSTQRNLSDAGRDQARRTGVVFRAHGIDRAQLYASPFCRCVETGELMGLGRVREQRFLAYPYRPHDDRDRRARRAIRWIQRLPLDGPVVLISHRPNLFDLSGYSLESGQMLVGRRNPDGGFTWLGTLGPY